MRFSLTAVLTALLTAAGLAASVMAPAAEAATRGPLIGVTITDGRDLSQDVAEFGHLPIIHVYYPGLPPRDAWSGLATAAKSAVIASFNASTSKILSGADDATLTHFFDTAPTGHKIYFTYIHEPEHEVAHGSLSVSAYRDAWAHIVRLANRASNPWLVPSLILEEYDLKIGRNWRQYLPAGNIIKMLAWDAYPGAIGDAPEAPSKFLGPAIAASRSVGLPCGFAEFGLKKMAVRPSWLTAVGTYLMSSGVKFGTYFDSSIVSTFRLTDSASQTAWRQWVQKSDTVNSLPH